MPNDAVEASWKMTMTSRCAATTNASQRIRLDLNGFEWINGWMDGWIRGIHRYLPYVLAVFSDMTC
jgi:hypothetical protein